MQDFYLPVLGYEGLYAVSDTGKVKSLDRTTPHGRRRKGVFLQQSLIYGYPHVTLCKNNKKTTVRVHRLEAEAFLLNLENKPQVHHRDHNRQNNQLGNLEWATPEENMQAASKAKRLDAKSRGKSSKLSADQVAQIRFKLSKGIATETIGKDFGVSGRTIRYIRSNFTWDGPRGEMPK